MSSDDRPLSHGVGLHTLRCDIWLEPKRKAPAPSDAEAGAVSAIADHSANGISGPLDIEPPVEAAGAARSSYLSGVAVRELRLMHALAVARLSLMDDPATFIEAACAVADLFPSMTCLGCGSTFVPVYRRQTKYCSDRCRYRIGMRNRRRKAGGRVTCHRKPRRRQVTRFVLRTRESAAGGPPAVTPAPTTPRPPLASTEDAPMDTPAHPLATPDVARSRVTA